MSKYDYVEPKLTSYLYVKASQNKIPLSGTFELTPLCNFNCKMCYIHMTPEQMLNSRKRVMNLEDWKSLAMEAKELGMLYLLLTGGEPFLYPYFKDLYIFLSKLGFVITINSNGSLIDEEMVEWLKERVPSRINITLYGASNETYEKLTGEKNGFDKVKKAIDLLLNAKIPIKLNCSLTPYNVDDLEKMIYFADERHIIIEVASYMFPAIRLSIENKGKNNRFSPQDVAKYILKTFELQRGQKALNQYAKDILSGSRPCNLEDCQDIEADGSIRCRAGKATFWASWDSKILPCGMMVEPAIKYEYRNFKKIWNELVNKTAQIKLSGQCSRCANQNICHVCAAMAYAETGGFEKTPKYLCQLVNALRENALSILDKYENKEKGEN